MIIQSIKHCCRETTIDSIFSYVITPCKPIKGCRFNSIVAEENVNP
jgi:hypothetical protein